MSYVFQGLNVNFLAYFRHYILSLSLSLSYKTSLSVRFSWRDFFIIEPFIAASQSLFVEIFQVSIVIAYKIFIW